MAKRTTDNMVALVRATARGKTLRKNHGGRELGGKGRDGRKWYHIHKLGRGLWTCDCPAYLFTTGKLGRKKPCKHLKKLAHDWKHACIDGIEVKILNVEAF